MGEEFSLRQSLVSRGDDDSLIVVEQVVCVSRQRKLQVVVAVVVL